MRPFSHLARRVIERGLSAIHADRTRLKWCAWQGWHYGEPELQLLPYLVDPDKTAIDVGAAEGLYSFYLSKMAKRCVAFEPNPDLHSFLKRTMPSLELYNAAVSGVEGESILRVPVVNGVPYRGWGTIEPKNRLNELPAHSLMQINVRTVRPDRMDLGDVGFVKIDVEGHEIDVLDGLSGLLRRCHPIILIEVGGESRGGSLSNVLRRLAPLGYIALALNQNGLLGVLHPNVIIKDAMNIIFIPLLQSRPAEVGTAP